MISITFNDIVNMMKEHEYYSLFKDINNIEFIGHHYLDCNGHDLMYNHMKLPKGSIKKLIGRELKKRRKS